MGAASNGSPGSLSRWGAGSPPASRWQLALRRLPLTLSVLLIVGGAAAGLAYVASGSGGHGMAATFYNDLGETVEVGSCADPKCKSGGSLDAQRVAARQSLLETLRTGSAVNPFLVTTLAGQRVGCLFLSYRRQPRESPVIPLSRVVRC